MIPASFMSRDASDWGLAVGRSELPPWLRSEVHRHRLRKPVWTKLLSPVKEFAKNPWRSSLRLMSSLVKA